MQLWTADETAMTRQIRKSKKVQFDFNSAEQDLTKNGKAHCAADAHDAPDPPSRQLVQKFQASFQTSHQYFHLCFVALEVIYMDSETISRG